MLGLGNFLPDIRPRSGAEPVLSPEAQKLRDIILNYIKPELVKKFGFGKQEVEKTGRKESPDARGLTKRMREGIREREQSADRSLKEKEEPEEAEKQPEPPARERGKLYFLPVKPEFSSELKDILEYQFILFSPDASEITGNPRQCSNFIHTCLNRQYEDVLLASIEVIYYSDTIHLIKIGPSNP